MKKYLAPPSDSNAGSGIVDHKRVMKDRAEALWGEYAFGAGALRSK